MGDRTGNTKEADLYVGTWYGKPIFQNSYHKVCLGYFEVLFNISQILMTIRTKKPSLNKHRNANSERFRNHALNIIEFQERTYIKAFEKLSPP